MLTNSSWVPDEDAQTLFSERTWLQGVIISAIAYGAILALVFLCFHLLFRITNPAEFKKRLPLLIYTVVSPLLNTLFMISLAAFTQMAFIDDRNYPGGPDAFENNMFSIPIDDMGNVAFVLSNWLADALVVWRFKIIYQECGVPIWLVMLLPSLMLTGSVAMGIMFLLQVSTTNPYVTNGINFTLPYYSLSLALNIVLTIAIVVRLLTLRYRITAVLGSRYATQYTSVTAMTIESAALYSAVSIAFLVLFAIGNAVSQVFLQSLGQFQTIAALLIVFRVAQGKGWTKETASRVMSAQGAECSDLSKIQFTTVCASLTLTSSDEMTGIVGGNAV